MKIKAFVSHSKPVSKWIDGFCSAFEDGLEGVEYFSYRATPVVGQLEDELRGEIWNSDLFICILERNYVSRPYCLEEFWYGLQVLNPSRRRSAMKHTFIPVAFDSAGMNFWEKVKSSPEAAWMKGFFPLNLVDSKGQWPDPIDYLQQIVEAAQKVATPLAKRSARSYVWTPEAARISVGKSFGGPMAEAAGAEVESSASVTSTSPVADMALIYLTGSHDGDETLKGFIRSIGTAYSPIATAVVCANAQAHDWWSQQTASIDATFPDNDFCRSTLCSTLNGDLNSPASQAELKILARSLKNNFEILKLGADGAAAPPAEYEEAPPIAAAPPADEDALEPPSQKADPIEIEDDPVAIVAAETNGESSTADGQGGALVRFEQIAPSPGQRAMLDASLRSFLTDAVSAARTTAPTRVDIAPFRPKYFAAIAEEVSKAEGVFVVSDLYMPNTPGTIEKEFYKYQLKLDQIDDKRRMLRVALIYNSYSEYQHLASFRDASLNRWFLLPFTDRGADQELKELLAEAYLYATAEAPAEHAD